MPLHLLGKKSWNVYNKDNIERVRRDEAAAKAAEEAEEQRMQEVDAARRIAILRGETPPSINPDEGHAATRDKGADASGGGKRQSRRRNDPVDSGGRRLRQRPGEDDTDFQMRLARQRQEIGSKAAAELRRTTTTTSTAPIVDGRGHIDLFGASDKKSRAHAEKNEEAERDASRKRREYEDQYTMRFANAGGKPGLGQPWYSSASARAEAGEQVMMKNVWGRDDPHRRERDEKRVAASDPLAAMKQGAARVRELKREREKFREEQEQGMRQMERDDDDDERMARRRRRRSRSPASEHRRGLGRGDGDEGHSRHRRRERDRSRDRHLRSRQRGHRSRSRERETRRGD